jgi:hypothetical protein
MNMPYNIEPVQERMPSLDYNVLQSTLNEVEEAQKDIKKTKKAQAPFEKSKLDEAVNEVFHSLPTAMGTAKEEDVDKTIDRTLQAGKYPGITKEQLKAEYEKQKGILGKAAERKERRKKIASIVKDISEKKN